MNQINAQTPANLAPGVDLYVTHALCPCIHFCDAPRAYEDRAPKHDERDANARLLSAGFNAFDKAGRELGIDAATLAEGIDFVGLIRAAQDALRVLDYIAMYPHAVETNHGKAIDSRDSLRASLASTKATP